MAEMSRVERVRAAIAGEEVDRVPAGFWFHFPADKAHGQASVEAHLDYYRASDVDFVKIMNEHPYQSRIPIRGPSDWARIEPAPLSAPFYQEQLAEVRGIVNALDGEALAIVTLFGPFASGNHASGNRVTKDIKAEPESVYHGLAAIAESLTAFAHACVDAGAAGVYYSAQGGEVDRFTREEFETYIKPHDVRVLQGVADHGEFHVLHICRDRVRLEAFVDYPCHVVNWAATKQNPSLVEGRKLFKRTLLGGMDDRGIMVDGSADEIRARVREVIREVGSRALIVGADCTLPTDIDVAHIRAAVQATKR